MANDNYKVYAHITPNNKIYIGITKRTLQQRFGKNGKEYKGVYFRSAIEKYGWDNIKHILITDGLSSDSAKRCEIELIKLYHSNDRRFGYNLTNGGDGVKGLKMSDEAKEKISQKKKGVKHPHTDEWNKKISEAKKGKKRYWTVNYERTDEWIEANRNRYKGRHWIVNSDGRRQWV